MSEALYGSFKDFIFKKAVKFLRGRKALPKDVYMKLDDEARAKAFTVSGYTALEVLQEFSDALADAVEQGKTKDDKGRLPEGDEHLPSGSRIRSHEPLEE